MFKKYIKETVKRELAKEKLNKQYGKSKTLVPHLNEVIHQQNSELSKLYNTISSLKQENEKLEESIKNLGGTVSSKDNLLNEKNKEIEELKEENKQLKDYRALDFKASLQTGYKLESLKQENEQLKNLSCTIVVDNDGKLDSLFNKQLRKENEQLKEAIENLEGKLILKGNLLTEQKEENKHLKNTLKLSKNTILELKDSYEQERNKNYKTLESEELKQENEKLKKELLDSKNGLNGANHVIKNNKEWINSQDKKIKELEEEIRCLKSDKEDLQYNLRRRSTQKIQLETKNKVLEEKLYAILNQVSSYNTAKETGDLSFFSLMCLINDIENILKES